MALLAATVVLVLAIIAAAGISSLQTSCRIDPITVDFGPLPDAEGFWTPEFNLENLEKIFVGLSPEDVTVDSRGVVYTGIKDGWVKEIGVDGSVKNHTFVGAQILGIAIGPGDEIYCAVPDKGLLKISTDGVVHLLADEVDGSKIIFADGLSVAKDGTVYFSDASTKFGMAKHMQDFFEGRLNGRILKYDPTTSSTSILVKDLGFANGVALSKDEDFLVFIETSRARVMRYWLTGEKVGTVETFIDGLLGFPDNVRRSESDGNFYIGLPAKRTKLTDWIFATRSQVLRCLVANPTLVGAMDAMTSGVLIVVTPEGKFVKKYEDPTGKLISQVTGGKVIGDFVYFNSLKTDFIGRLKL